MNFPELDDIDELSEKNMTKKTIALIRGLYKISDHFYEMNIETVKTIYTKLIEALDEADDMDSFGTEGWRQFIE